MVQQGTLWVFRSPATWLVTCNGDAIKILFGSKDIGKYMFNTFCTNNLRHLINVSPKTRQFDVFSYDIIKIISWYSDNQFERYLGTDTKTDRQTNRHTHRGAGTNCDHHAQCAIAYWDRNTL